MSVRPVVLKKIHHQRLIFWAKQLIVAKCIIFLFFQEYTIHLVYDVI
jgi:hypothetical protein